MAGRYLYGLRDTATSAPSVTAPQYYEGKTVLVTGATGFLGKVLVEKLLRSCPGLEKVYVLIRQKKGFTSEERLEQFVNNRIFENLRLETPELLSKLRLVPGDITQSALAMSPADRAELTKTCQVVFHCAACVRFDMKIRDALNLNTTGTKRVLDLAENMEKLEIFLHVSTAYLLSEVSVLEERLYSSRHRPQHIMSAVEWMDDDLLQHLEKKLIHPHPNTYSYTKLLTEELVSQYAGKFPIAIARPSIVTASYKEPMPGWVDNLNGPTGLLVGAAKGVIRTMLLNEEYNADVVPVDMVVNACILFAYRSALQKPRDIVVMNISESSLNPITWGHSLELGRHHVGEFPFSVSLWYPGGSPKKSKIAHNIATFFSHLLPALFIDAMLRIFGRKPFMMEVQRRITAGQSVLQYYTMRRWQFLNDSFAALKDTVSTKDNEVFYTDIKVIEWSSYVRDYIKGAREYCCNEDPSNLPQARRLYRRLFYADIVFKTLLYGLLAYMFYSILMSVF